MKQTIGATAAVIGIVLVAFLLLRDWQQSLLLLLPPNADFDGVLSLASRLMYEHPFPAIQIGVGMPLALLGGVLLAMRRRVVGRILLALAVVWTLVVGFAGHAGYRFVAEQAGSSSGR